VENCLTGLLRLAPELAEDLLSNVDQPLQVATDPADGRQFIQCDYNRDGDAYRSPWSNTYCAGEGEGEMFPRQDLREMEVEANALFDVYRKQYFNGGTSSVYYFETVEDDTNAFGACFLVHNEVPPSGNLVSGRWDSIHVIDCSAGADGKWTYQLTSTVMVAMNIMVGTHKVDLSGNMTKQESKTAALGPGGHIEIIGRLIEETELIIRNNIEGIYIQKTREIMHGIRNPDQAKMAAWENVQKALAANLASR
jgi:capping protein beta